MTKAAIDVQETIWITLPDGTQLAARLWLPRDVGPLPCILEYIPYRRRDRTRMRDESMHPLFAEAGYASIRVDIRGYGDSDGLAKDEYSHQEIQDGHDVVQWIAAQDWCDGSVGMFGKELGRLQRLPGSRNTAARAEGHRPGDGATTAGARISISTVAALPTTISGGARSCSSTTRCRPIRKSSGIAGATCGANGWTGARFWPAHVAGASDP